MLFKLFQNQWCIAKNGWSRGVGGKSKWRVLFLLTMLALPIWIFQAAKGMFQAWLYLPEFSPNTLYNFMSGTFMGLLFLLAISGVPIILHYEFLGKDLPLLLSSPIERRTVFQFKFLQAAFFNSTLFYYLGFPLLGALAAATKAPVYFYIIAFIASLFFLIIPNFLSIIAAVLLIRIITVKRAKNLATALVGIAFLLAWTGFQFLRLSRLDPRSSDFAPVLSTHFGHQTVLKIFSVFPSEWLIKMLFRLKDGFIGTAALYFFMLLALSLLCFYLSAAFIDWTYRNDLVNINQGTKIKRHRFKIFPKSAGAVTTTKTILAIIDRDIKLIYRDSRHLTQIFFFFTMMIVFPLIIKNDSGDLGRVWNNYFPYVFLLLFASLMSASLSSRLIPLEGISYGLMKSFPLSSGKIILAKISFSFISILAIVISATWFLAFRLKSPHYVFQVVLWFSPFVILASIGIGIFLGVKYARFDWDNPKRMLHLHGLLQLSFFTSLMFLFGVLIVSFTSHYTNLYAGVVLSSLYCITIIWAGTRNAVRRLEKLEWIF
ncbi:MAG: hypothetical protein GXO75_01060 [Calditrichaeota bacterium]|nr:hypothetical protein [Calditrichota bacterium]